MTHKLIIINGPNLNMLGTREKNIYGEVTLEAIEALCKEEAGSHGAEAACYQSNAEDAIIEVIHKAKDEADGIIINAAAYTHTSVAIMDALLAVGKPVIEVHLSNIFAREEFRHQSYISPAAKGVICGFGAEGYRLAIQGLVKHLSEA